MSTPTAQHASLNRAILAGFALGVLVLLGVWGATLAGQHRPFTWRELMDAHASSPAMWLFLLLPAACAVVAAHRAALVSALAGERDQVIALNERVRQNELYRAFFDGTLEGVFIVDRRGAVLDANASAQMMFGYDRELLIEKPILELVPEHGDASKHHSVQRVTSKNLPLGIEWHVMGQHRDGTTFPAELSIHRGLLNGKRAVRVYVLRDTAGMTDRLRRANHFLAAVRDRALEEARSKDRFIAKMSYELRTPLNAVLGYTDMLVEDAEDLGIAHILADLHRVQRGGRHMLAVIANVLELTRSDDGDAQCLPELLAVGPVLSDMEVAIRRHLHRRKNDFVIDLHPDVSTVYADRILLRQVLLKLLDNACRYTLHGHIAATVTREPSGNTALVRFEICDTGNGMDAETLRLALAGTGGPQRADGTTLSLAAAREFVLRMDGELTGTSSPGEGTCFTLRIPETAPPHLSGPIADFGQDLGQ